ncbi:hypothetical protein ACQEUU_32955 [Nonomuraea sp. CA-218870]|uniref:hypothetical protein n=1 Tax=Nonomuraea sp. CA-218870 TaxID=3239998 RepID=UPI003D8B7159
MSRVAGDIAVSRRATATGLPGSTSKRGPHPRVIFDTIAGAGAEPSPDDLRAGVRELLAGMLHRDPADPSDGSGGGGEDGGRPGVSR